jgi:5'-nucleotidase
MRILLSNDDGYRAPGLLCLWRTLSKQWEVTVAAPDRDRSGASNSLTLRNPLRSEQRENGFIVIEGTPTDCVHLALTGLLDPEPDLVVSGINAGGNLGDDVLYSGTVAAALEGRHLGLPAIAVSLVGRDPHCYETAAAVVERLLGTLTHGSIPPGTVLNVNVPDLPLDRIEGVRVTRLGHRHRSRPAVRDRDPAGEPIYWFGEAGSARDNAPDTDFHAVEEGFVSVTPLHADLTRHSSLGTISSWIGKLGFDADF